MKDDVIGVGRNLHPLGGLAGYAGRGVIGWLGDLWGRRYSFLQVDSR
jgi:hypothetical protein